LHQISLVNNFSYGFFFSQAEDRLEGASNFTAWKARIFNILEESDLNEVVTRVMEEPILEESDLDEVVTRVMDEPTTNAGRGAYNKRLGKANRVIFDSIKDSMMPLIAYLRTTKECFDALANLYEKKAPTQKRTLKKQLRTLKGLTGEKDIRVSFTLLLLLKRKELTGGSLERFLVIKKQEKNITLFQLSQAL
jgi:hypothetical protein